MAGIVASSATVAMLGSETAPDKVVSGYLANESIALSVTPSGDDYDWTMAKPSGATGRSELVEDDVASTSFVPDRAGLWLIQVVVDSTTTYVIRIAVAAVTQTTIAQAFRCSPVADATVPAPPVGEALFFSKTADEWSSKDSNDVVRRLAFVGSGSMETLTALGALDDSGADDGAAVAVASLQDIFILDKSSTLTADGITVVPTASGTGRWLRAGLTSPRWLGQADWYIDATAGDNENSGASGSPIASINEYVRRIGTGKTTTSAPHKIYLTGDFTEERITLQGFYPNSLEFYGERTVLGTGSVTAKTDYSEAASVVGEITDSALPVSWTDSGFVGKTIVLTSGASIGAVAVIGKDLGTKRARHSPFTVPWSWVTKHPGVGDTYEIVEQTKIEARWNIHCPDNIGHTFMRDIELVLPTAAWGTLAFEMTSGVLIFETGAITCADSTAYMQVAGHGIHGVASKLDLQGNTDGVVCRLGTFQWDWGLLAANVSCWREGLVFVRNTLIQCGFGAAGGNVTFGLQYSAGVRISTGLVAYCDQTGATGGLLYMRENAWVRCEGKLFGTGNAGFGLWLSAGCQFVYPDGDNLTAHLDIATTGTEVRCGGIDTTYAAIGAVGVVNAANNAMVVPGEFSR